MYLVRNIFYLTSLFKRPAVGYRSFIAVLRTNSKLVNPEKPVLFSTLPGFRQDDLELEYLPEITSRGLSLATR